MSDRVLVIGGGIAGIQASLDLADAGARVVLVERQATIGGIMAVLDKNFPTLDCSICIEAPKMSQVDLHPNIKYLYSLSVLKKFNGFVFGIGVSASYRLGEDPDAPQAIVRSIKFGEATLPPLFSAMQSYYVKNAVGSVEIKWAGYRLTRLLGFGTEIRRGDLDGDGEVERDEIINVRTITIEHLEPRPATLQQVLNLIGRPDNGS